MQEIKKTNKNLPYFLEKVLEYMLKCQMIRTYVFPFTKEINLNEVKRSHIIIADKKDKVYIVAYDKGEYLNDYIKNNIQIILDDVVEVEMSPYDLTLGRIIYRL